MTRAAPRRSGRGVRQRRCGIAPMIRRSHYLRGEALFLQRRLDEALDAHAAATRLAMRGRRRSRRRDERSGARRFRLDEPHAARRFRKRLASGRRGSRPAPPRRDHRRRLAAAHAAGMGRGRACRRARAGALLSRARRHDPVRPLSAAAGRARGAGPGRGAAGADPAAAQPAGRCRSRAVGRSRIIRRRGSGATPRSTSPSCRMPFAPRSARSRPRSRI